MLTLSVSQRRDLKARAHALNPVVIIGNAGLTPAVLDEIERSLKSHDLMKIRVMNDDREAREAMLQEICETLKAGPVQHIGKVLVVYTARWKSQSPKRPNAVRAKSLRLKNNSAATLRSGFARLGREKGKGGRDKPISLRRKGFTLLPSLFSLLCH